MCQTSNMPFLSWLAALTLLLYLLWSPHWIIIEFIWWIKSFKGKGEKSQSYLLFFISGSIDFVFTWVFTEV